MLPWRRGWWSERLVEESAIKAVLEDRTDRGDGASLDQDAASAGRIDTRIVVAPGERQDAKAGAKALLGMRPGLDDSLEKRGGRGADLLAGGDQPSRRPLAVAAMSAGHVVGDGGVAAPVGRTGVAGDPLTLVEDLDGLVSDADIDEFTYQAVRGGIPMAVDLDVIIGGDAATLPARKDVGLVGQLSQLGRSISANSSARLEPKPRIWRALSSTTSPRMAALSSAREKKRWLRRRASIQRWAIWTATSTLALSFGASASPPGWRCRNGRPSRHRCG